MNPTDKTSFIPYIIIAALVVWRVYARVQRMVRRQKFSSVRSWITVALFPALIVLLALATFTQRSSELAELGGAAIGVALGIVGLRTTKYEATPEGLFYTPNAHIGIALSLLMVGRLIYRYFQMYAPAQLVAQANSMQNNGANYFISSPLTLLIFGTLAGYYSTYAIGLLRWSRSATVDEQIVKQEGQG
jgi:cytochrome b561